MKRYEVVEDLQGGEFGMGRQYTAEEWLEQAIDWLEADDIDGRVIEDYKAHWTEKIKAGREQELIEYIAEMWQLDIQEVKKEVKEIQ